LPLTNARRRKSIASAATFRLGSEQRLHVETDLPGAQVDVSYMRAPEAADQSLQTP
jgi:hypothetical protein